MKLTQHIEIWKRGLRYGIFSGIMVAVFGMLTGNEWLFTSDWDPIIESRLIPLSWLDVNELMTIRKYEEAKLELINKKMQSK